MIAEAREERASLYALGLLETNDARSFEHEIATDSELAHLVRDLQSAAEALARSVPQHQPAPELRARIIAHAQSNLRGAAVPIQTRGSFHARLAWAAAIALLATSMALLFDRAHLKNQIAVLQQRNVIASLEIRTLNSLLDNAPKAVAVAIWDKDKQQGILQVENMPAARADQDYQLWVIDPAYPLPVNAGVFKVPAEGIGTASFKTSQPVASADKFAISLEGKGGAPQHKGPIVMISK